MKYDCKEYVDLLESIMGNGDSLQESMKRLILHAEYCDSYESIKFQILDKDGEWFDTSFKSWEDVVGESTEEIKDKELNKNGIRIFRDNNKFLFIIREVNE